MSATCRWSLSTATVPVAERLAYWERSNAETLLGLTCRTYEQESLVARLVNLDLGAVRVDEIAGNPHVVERAPALVAAGPKGATFVTVLTAGEAFFYHDAGLERLGPGDAIVYDTDRPYLFGFGTHMRQLLVDLPATEERGVRPPRIPVVVRGGGAGPRAAVVRRLTAVLEAAVADPAGVGDDVAPLVVDAVSGLLLDRSDAGRAGVVSALEAFVEEHLADPGLDADLVGAALGFSVRHLNRLLDGDATVARLIADGRLRGARADLADPALADRPISEIAHRWVFASQAHFATVFRRTYGCTPSQWRAAAAAGVESAVCHR